MARVTLGVAHAGNIALARKCNELLLPSKCLFHISFHHVFSNAGNAGNECADVAASFGMPEQLRPETFRLSKRQKNSPCYLLAELLPE